MINFLNLKMRRMAMITAMASLILFSACNDDKKPAPAVVASFQATASDDNFLMVSFTNASMGTSSAATYMWDFGDNTGTSTDREPTYTYTAAGTYTVVLTVTEGTVTDDFMASVTIVDPLAAQRALVGTSGKTWKLLADADVSGGAFPIKVGSADESEIWFALGNGNELCVRECIFNDTWTFNTDGTYAYDNMGDVWAEGGIWPAAIAESCLDAVDEAAFVGADGQDLSAWDSGTNPFVYNPMTAELTVTGGFIGLTKAGSIADDIKEPQTSVTYSVAKLVDIDNGVDTLVLETSIQAGAGKWTIVLVSYDDAASEVTVEACPIVLAADFTFMADEANHLMITFTNTSTAAASYAWDFGDAAGTNTEENPTYTYTSEGTYQVMLTVTGEDGTTTAMITKAVAAVAAPCDVDAASEKELVGGFLLTFDDDSPLGGFGRVVSSVVDNPYFAVDGNSSCKVNSFFKATGSEVWAGVAINFPVSDDDTTPQQHDIANAPIFEFDLYAETEGVMTVIFEHMSSPNNVPAITNTYTVEAAEVGQWIRVSFDLTAQLATNAGTHPTMNTYNNLVFQYNLGTAGADEQIYIDNVQLKSN